VHLRTLGVVVLVGFLVATAARCQTAIFGEPLPGEPFDRVAFRPVLLPEWVNSTLGAGYTLSGMDSAARERAAKAGVSLSELNFVDPFYPYYDSKLLKKRSPHVGLDRLAKDVAEYKKLGVRILGVYPPCLQSEVYENHPEWRRVTTADGKVPQVDMRKEPHGGMLCLQGPYGDFFIEVLAEILKLFPDVDAFSFDGLHHGGFCYCEHCRNDFMKATGKAIPAVNMEDSGFREYQHWADRRMEDLVRRMQKRLKGIKPSVALATWSTNAGRWGHFLSIPRNMPGRMNLLFDAPDQEFWMDESNRGGTIVPAFGNAFAWSGSNHRVAYSEPYLMSHGNPYSKDSLPAHELRRRLLLVATHGGFPSLAVSQPKRLQQAAYAGLEEIRALKPWLVKQQPEPWAAMVVSDNTRNFYGRSSGEVEEKYLAHTLGYFRAMLEEHLPFNLYQDWNVQDADLAKHKVLILPNTACLSEEQAAAIRRFVTSGGGLVASMDTGAFDATGNARTRSLLEDLLGVKHLGPVAEAGGKVALDWNFEKGVGPDYWLKRKGARTVLIAQEGPLASTSLAELVDDTAVVFKGPALAVEAVGASTAQMWYLDAKGLKSPAVITRPFGKGRVVYFAAGVDAGYYLYAYPWQRVMLANAVRWAAGSAPPVQVKAPMCVHATVRRQVEANRLVVHLYNDINTTGGRALPQDDVPLREETLPIYGIEVVFDGGLSVEKVTMQPGGEELEVMSDGKNTKVVVPKLAIHQLVVAELRSK